MSEWQANGLHGLDTGTPAARILLVDDQPANIQMVGGVLGKLGHEIVPACDGPTALRRLELRRPDLILLDLFMPEMDGCEVCRRLQANPDWKDIPVIFLSGADDKDLVVRALESGGVDYVTKPFHHAELILRVQTQLALKLTRDRLKQLAEDKDELIGILAHDLKSHLGGIQTTAGLLRDLVGRVGNTDRRAPQLAANIAHSSGHLLTFVKEFLANAAADHGIVFRPVRLLLTDAAAGAVAQYQDAAERKQLTLEMSLPPGDSFIWADPVAVRQILDNLLSNAVKFSPPGRSIFVRVESEPNHVICRIRDQGPGFTADDRTKMFRRYYRLSARPTAAEPSTGLGLSIVRKLVSALKGELACESEPGAGAEFVVRLPRAGIT